MVEGKDGELVFFSEWVKVVDLFIWELEKVIKEGEWVKCKMVEVNFWLVVFVVKKYFKCNLDLFDFI